MVVSSLADAENGRKYNRKRRNRKGFGTRKTEGFPLFSFPSLTAAFRRAEERSRLAEGHREAAWP
jgi:hypothetical protein